jgi:hypothetical protein
MLNTLPTIAEIAVVITGFVGLAVAIRPTLLSTKDVDGIRLRLQIAQTLTLMFLCLLPSFIIEIQAEPTLEPWPAANGAMAILLVGLTAWRVRAQATVSDRGKSSPLILGVVLHIPIIVGSGLNAVGILERHGSAIFYAGVLVQLLTSSANFVLLLFATTEEKA